MFCGEGLAAVVLLEARFDVLGGTNVTATCLFTAQHVDGEHAEELGRAGGI